MKKLFTTSMQGLGNVVAAGLQAVRTHEDREVSVVDENGVPVAWRLFGFGPFSITRDGVSVGGEFLREHAEQILSYYETKGTRIPIDSEHYIYQLAQKLGVDEADIVAVLRDRRAAMGFGRLEIREDGLWLVDVTWSDTAYQLMSEHIFRFFSPVIRGLRDGRLRITSVAMTNTPAIDQLAEIAASAEAAETDAREWATVALSDLNRADTPKQKGEQPMKKLLALMGAIVGIDSIALSDDGEVPAEITAALEGLKTELPGLRATATAQTEFLAGVTDALALGAEATLNDVQGAILGLVERAKGADELKARVDALELSAETSRLAEVIDKGMAAGKLTKAMIESAWGKKQDSVSLSAFLDAAPVIAAPGKTLDTHTLPTDTIALTAEEREMCRNMGLSEEKYLEQKKEDAAA